MARHVAQTLRDITRAAMVLACLAVGSVASEPNNACEEAIAGALRSNAFKLFEGYVACGRDNREQDTNYLIILGQLRAMPDMAVLKPVDDAGMQKAAALYGQIFYQFGGLGFDAFYRTPANVTALEERLRSAELKLYDGYDPGWAHKSSAKAALYENVFVNARERRLWQMRSFALNVQNDEYWALHQARNAIPQPLIAGSPEQIEHDRLSARLEEIDEAIPDLPPPPDTTDYAALTAPDPEMAARQVAEGFNGRAVDGLGAFLIRSEEELRQSWLARALDNAALEALIAKTDFSTQVLVGFAFGKSLGASEVKIASLTSRPDVGYQINVLLGLVPGSCGGERVVSYPFVVGVADAVPGGQITGQGRSNYPASCGPVRSGEPTAP